MAKKGKRKAVKTQAKAKGAAAVAKAAPKKTRPIRRSGPWRS